MPKGVRLNQESFLERANEIFKGRLDFSKSVFVNSNSRIIVTCPIHGDYETTAKNILSSYGCKQCARITIAKKMSDTQETFLEKARKVHGDEYDYTKVKYVNNNTKVEIVCPKHGSFFVLPRVHISGHKCSKCMNVGSDRDYFMEKSNEIHNNKYDYSKVVYKKASAKVEIICPIHGSFHQTPNSHISGSGCKKCQSDKKSKDMRTVIYGVAINDSEEYIKKDGKMTECYNVWFGMVRRCYSEKHQDTHKVYIGCKLADDWLTFSVFKKWFEDPVNGYREGYHLEKDLISGKVNKMYSPDNCCFVPPHINSLITRSCTLRGDLPIGVSECNGRYRTRFSKWNKLINFGLYDTPEEAFNVYKIEKELHIKEVADYYYNRGEITKKVYDALCRYKVEITD